MNIFWLNECCLIYENYVLLCNTYTVSSQPDFMLLKGEDCTSQDPAVPITSKASNI